MYNHLFPNIESFSPSTNIKFLFFPFFENASKVVAERMLYCPYCRREIYKGESYYITYGEDDGSLYESIYCFLCEEERHDIIEKEYKKLFSGRIANG